MEWINYDPSPNYMKYYVDIKENNLPLAVVILDVGSL